MILLDGVTKKYPGDEKPALDGVSLHIEPNEFVFLVGKSGAGKSTLMNMLSGAERSIVTDVAGTTRDAIDTHYEKDGDRFLFIDTAGIRRKSRVNEAIEKFSVIRSYAAVDRSDVCIIMIDGTEGIAEQDTKIAGYADEQGKACIFVINKWDIVKKNDKTINELRVES